MRVIIAKVDEVLFDGEVKSVTLPGSAGEMTVLGHHMPLITTLKAGVLTVRLPAQAGGEGSEEVKRFEIESGVLEVHGEEAVVVL